MVLPPAPTRSIKAEQRRRFLARLDDPDKNWKFGADDIRERGRWKEYMSAYEKCLAATSTKSAPWYIVPADDKPNARLIVSQAILDALEKLKMRPPRASPAARRALNSARRQLSGS